MTADRVLLTAGTSEGIEIALNALANPGDEVLVPSPTYPLYTAVTAKIAAKTVYYRTDPKNGWLPDLDQIRSLITPNTRALVVIDPNNPTGAIYPESMRRELIALARRTGSCCWPTRCTATWRTTAPRRPWPASTPTRR